MWMANKDFFKEVKHSDMWDCLCNTGVHNTHSKTSVYSILIKDHSYDEIDAKRFFIYRHCFVFIVYP